MLTNNKGQLDIVTQKTNTEYKESRPSRHFTTLVKTTFHLK